jgi:hypothetical protein
MIELHLEEVAHEYKIGHQPAELPPSFTGDALFMAGGEPLGFYIEKIPERLKKLTDVANYELNSPRVPKTVMTRASKFRGDESAVDQYSTIIGSIPPKAIMRRPYPSRSSVHGVETAQTFIKAMTMAGKEALGIVEQTVPELYRVHREAVTACVPEKWRFCDLFTSSISNYNIAAPIHRDTLNVKGALNVIITKRMNCTGGNLFIPDYNITINSAHDSMLVYPAWRNTHGVTPIVAKHDNGFRNSLVWYALDAFREKDD